MSQGTIGLLTAAVNENNKAEKDVAFKNNILFRSCISKMNNASIGNPEDFDIFMSVYNLLEYSDNYSMTSGSLWNDIEMKLMVSMIMLHRVNQPNIKQK